MPLDAPSPQDSQQLLLYKIAAATTETAGSAVRFTEQTLTEQEQAQARTNLGIGSGGTVVLAPSNAVASDGVAVNGSDLRLRSGGIVAAKTLAYNEITSRLSASGAVAGAWTLAFTVQVPSTTTGTVCFLGTGGSSGGWGLTYLASTNALRFEKVGNASGPIGTFNLKDGNWHTIVVSCAADKRTFDVSVDGTAMTTSVNGSFDSGVFEFVGYGVGYPCPAGVRFGSFLQVNYAETYANMVKHLRGEGTATLIGGTPRSSFTGAMTFHYGTSPTINTNGGGVFDVTYPQGTDPLSAYKTDSASPLSEVDSNGSVRIGRTIRFRYTLNLRSGAAPKVTLYKGIVASAGTALSHGTGYVDIPITADLSGYTGYKLGYYIGVEAASDFNLSACSMEVLGAQILIGQHDWAWTRGVDRSNNCNDIFIPPGVVIPANPVSAVRAIKFTTNGTSASPTTGTVGDVGTTYTGQTFRDKQAIAALRAGDNVHCCWTAARPANSYGITAVVATNGTPTVQTLAVGGNVSVSNGTVITLTAAIS